LLDRGFDFFDGTHGRQYTSLGHRRQRFLSGLTVAINGSRPSGKHHPRCRREAIASRGYALSLSSTG
jgi:hypothetical protein